MLTDKGILLDVSSNQLTDKNLIDLTGCTTEEQLLKYLLIMKHYAKYGEFILNNQKDIPEELHDILNKGFEKSLKDKPTRNRK